jgi:hypothetical protein
VAQLIQAQRLTPSGRVIIVQPELMGGPAENQQEQKADRTAKALILREQSSTQAQDATAVTPRRWSERDESSSWTEKQISGPHASVREIILWTATNGHVLQRRIGDGHDLTSVRFAGDETLEACYDGEKSRYLRYGSRGEPVTKIQQALIDLGYSMPISTKKTGSPDGIFGAETSRTVKQFQRDYGLTQIDAIVGPETIARFDELFGGGVSPKKKEPEIEATEEAVGKRVAEQIEAANIGPHTADQGIHYARNYRDSFPDRWKPEYMDGYADPNYFVRLGFMNWVLKPRVSASDAIRSWIKGLTIAECLTTIVAIEYDTLRAAIGDNKFDQIFGAADQVLPSDKLLHIAPPPAKLPLDDYMKATEAAAAGNEGVINDRPAKVGEWYYFYNHPKYLLKHPAGEWQGENAIYMGKDETGNQLWSGLGTINPSGTSTKVTEDEMLEQMVDAYNGARDADDIARLENIKRNNGGALPKEYVFEDEGGELPRTIDKSRVLNDPPYTVGSVTRKGGFLVAAGQTIDIEKVKSLRNAP